LLINDIPSFCFSVANDILYTTNFTMIFSAIPSVALTEKLIVDKKENLEFRMIVIRMP